MKLNAQPLTDALILWWDQWDPLPADAEYELHCEDQKPEQGGKRRAGQENAADQSAERRVYAGRRTHFTLEDLAPASAYRLCLYAGGTLLAEGCFETRKETRVHDVRDYGAVGDGKTLNTSALQSAMDACGKDEEVLIPAGVFLTGGLRLHSDMRLRIAPGAELRGTDRPEDYLPKIRSRFEGTEMECYQSLLNLGELDHAAGPNCRNVLIYGGGKICGGGQPLARNTIEAEKLRLREMLASLGEKIREYENEETIPGRARGRLINLSNCENVHITGLDLENGPSWNVHMIYSRNIVTDHCFFRSEGVWNGDGWDPDSSEDCTLFACHFHTGDDSVAIKSGKNPEGNRIARPTRNIRVFDCRSDFGLGVAIGSEMSGGVEKVAVWDCDFSKSLYGVQVKATRKRGGYVRGLTVRDSLLSRFRCCAVGYNDDGEGSPVPPVFEGFTLERVRLTGWAMEYWESENHQNPAIDLTGFDVPGYEARDMVFRDCDIGEQGSIAMSRCRNITLEGITAQGVYDHPENFWIGNENQITQK